MLVASVHDPEVFSAKSVENPLYRGLLCDHAMHMAHSHVMVCDLEGLIGKALMAGLAKLPGDVFKKLEAVLANPASIVRLPIQDDICAAITNIMPDRPVTATALALSRQNGVDATIVSQDGREAIQLADLGNSRIMTLDEYAINARKDCERAGMGAVSLNGMSKGGFIRDILEPFLRWSEKIVLFDPMLARSMFGQNTAWSNWPVFRRTIRCIYETWTESCLKPKDSFEVVTLPNTRWDEEWQRRWIEQGLPDDYEQQARLLAQDLDLGLACVRLIPPEIKELQHDRYLVSNRGKILSFSRGFDFLREDDKLIECAVSLYTEGRGRSVSRLLSSRDLAKWPNPSLSTWSQKRT